MSDVSVSRGEVRVLNPDQDNKVTGWLPVVVPRHLKNNAAALPAINETVVYVSLGSGLEAGYCLGVFHEGAAQ
ncbi:hypothetical protein M3180_06330 [Paenibacillus camelliae]|nr:hypothetical protein [Paenibacillus camelliae]